jgi:hypothetical protein
MSHERTFRTEGGRQRDAAPLSIMRVEGLTCRVKKITCTDEGKLTMTIEATAADDDTLERVRDLILIQQGEVSLSLEGVLDVGESVQ